MAGDWIKMRCDLAEDPAVIGIAEALGVDEYLVVGKLHRLWSWADRQSVDGNAIGVTHSWIDRYLRAPGFAAAMLAVGWLVVDDGSVTLPNFERHNGKTAKARADTAKRVAAHRAGCNGKGNGASVTSPLAREEKRREEEKPKAPAPAEPAQTLPADLPSDIAKPDGPAADKAPRKAPATAVEFPVFWAAYPVKKGKQDALKAWKKLGLDGRAAELVAHVRRMEREDVRWLDSFIPHPATYLNGQRWEDEPEHKQSVATATTPRPPESFGSKVALARTESKLENALGFALQQFNIHGDRARYEADVAAAHAKHGGDNGQK